MNPTTHERHERARSVGGTTDFELEGDQLRANMDRTLDEIQRKLSPGELLDRSMQFVREHGSELVREAGETVRRNPVPVLLTAAGVIWLTAAVASSRSRAEERSPRRSRGTSGDHISAESIESIPSSWDDFEPEQNSTRSASWGNRADAVGSHLTRLVKDQPVALGALALAAGALLGAALPMTDYENRMVGPAHDRTVERVKEAGRRQYETVRDAVASSLERDSSGETPASS